MKVSVGIAPLAVAGGSARICRARGSMATMKYSYSASGRRGVSFRPIVPGTGLSAIVGGEVAGDIPLPARKSAGVVASTSARHAADDHLLVRRECSE